MHSQKTTKSNICKGQRVNRISSILFYLSPAASNLAQRGERGEVVSSRERSIIVTIHSVAAVAVALLLCCATLRHPSASTPAAFSQQQRRVSFFFISFLFLLLFRLLLSSSSSSSSQVHSTVLYSAVHSCCCCCCCCFLSCVFYAHSSLFSITSLNNREYTILITIQYNYDTE